LTVIGLVLCESATTGSTADLGYPAADAPVASSEWTFAFTPYAWLAFMSGRAEVGSTTLDVDLTPGDILRNLDWSEVPIWMSYAELRRGPLSFFNDIMWTAVEAADGFERRFVSGQVEVDYSQLTVELGAAYSVWSEGGGTVDVLAGGRYWRQETDVYLQTDRVALDRSGTVDWVDPFVGARWMQSVAPGQSILVRGDIGGFGAGSDFSWQALATYNLKLCETDGHTINGYVGYRALSVDYSEGAYEYDVLQQGPIAGLSVNF